MKQRLRNILATTSSFIEIYINALIIIGIIIFSVVIVKDLYDTIVTIISGNIVLDIEFFLGHALQLIIGVEFVKMIAKHTTDSALDVLVFAIARKMIIEHDNSMLDLLVGSVAIAVLFILRKNFFSLSSYNGDNSIIFNGGTSIEKVNKQLGVNIPDNLGKTIAGALVNHLKSIDKKIKVGYTLQFEDVELQIYSMDEELIKQVKVTTSKNHNNILTKIIK